jgi:hypothetical protein
MPKAGISAVVRSGRMPKCVKNPIFTKAEPMKLASMLIAIERLVPCLGS